MDELNIASIPEAQLSTRARVLRRDGFRCRYCLVNLRPEEITYDHVVPISKGGPSTYSNQVVACRRCNQDKSDTDLNVWFACLAVWIEPEPKRDPLVTTIGELYPELEPARWAT